MGRWDSYGGNISNVRGGSGSVQSIRILMENFQNVGMLTRASSRFTPRTHIYIVVVHTLFSSIQKIIRSIFFNILHIFCFHLFLCALCIVWLLSFSAITNAAFSTTGPFLRLFSYLEAASSVALTEYYAIYLSIFNHLIHKRAKQCKSKTQTVHKCQYK